MILTIAIPTYNRPRQVKDALLQLIPQLTDEVCIRVIDNCSDTDIKSYIESEIGNIGSNIEIIKNEVNIGSDANFVQCFALCKTPYIWMIGDDDEIDSAAIKLILDEIEKYKDLDLIGINFKSNCLTVERSAPVFINSIAQLGERLDHFGNWLFISTTVYKTSSYLKHLHLSLKGTYAMASQLVAPLIAISNGKILVLSEKYLVTNIEARDPEQRWSDVPMTLGVLSLLEAPLGLEKEEFLMLGKRMNVQFVSFTDLLCSIVKSINFNLKLIDAFHLYIFKQIYHRTIQFRNNYALAFVSYYSTLLLLQNRLLLNLALKFNKRLRNRVKETRSYYLFERPERS